MARTSVEDVVAGLVVTSGRPSVAVVTPQHVVSVLAEDGVAVAATVELVVPRSTTDRVAFSISANDVVARATKHQVIPETGTEVAVARR